MNNEESRETRAIVTGLGLVCFALFAGVSLYTHSPYDVLDYHAAQSQEIQNKAGLIGAQVAHHVFCLYGIGAWVLTILMLLCGSWICAVRSMSGFLAKAFGSLLLTALVCTWAAAMGDSAPASESCPAGPGGLLGGTFLAPPLISYFGRVGVYMVLTTVGVLCCLLLAPGLTELLLTLVGRSVVSSGLWFANWVLGRVQEIPAVAAAQPVLAPVNADADAGQAGCSAGVSPAANARVAVFPASATRRNVGPLSGVGIQDEEPSNRLRRVRAARGDGEDEAAVRRIPKPPPEDEEEELSEEEEAELRRQEALRQVEAADAARLEREKEAREQSLQQSKALERLERERAAKEEQRAKQQEKFAAVMAEAAGSSAASGSPASTEAGGTPAIRGAGVLPAPTEATEAAKPKPQLPEKYDLPQYDLLIANDVTPEITSETLKERGMTVIQTLWDFKIESKLVAVHSGPTVTMYELELAPGVKVSRVVGLQDNLAIALKAGNGVRVVYPIPNKNTIGIEIPNKEEHTVRMRPILESPQFRAKSWKLPLILGRDAVGNPLVAELADMPHLLIAGTTGSGKSVCVNSIILSTMILRRPHEVKLILVDPKQVEMHDFKGIPHLLSPVVTDMKLAAGVLTWAVQKMEDRFDLMAKLGVRNISTFNRMSKEERISKLPPDTPPEDFFEPMPYILVVVDEFADLMLVAGKEIEQAVQRLAQKARAAGIHVILATQRPDATTVTGIIKANFPCRICFQVKSKIDSRIILEQNGGEKLAGKGDMLYIGPGNSNMIRAKGVYIADEEIRKVVDCCKAQAEPVYSDEIERVAALSAGKDAGEGDENNRQAIEMDDKFDEGVEVFLLCGRASTSLLQRRMGLGYTRAAKLCDQMEARGIVGPDRGPKGRELLITQEQWDEFKRIRASAPSGPSGSDSAWGPKGSKDNPITGSGTGVPARESTAGVSPALDDPSVPASVGRPSGSPDDPEDRPTGPARESSSGVPARGEESDDEPLPAEVAAIRGHDPLSGSLEIGPEASGVSPDRRRKLRPEGEKPDPALLAQLSPIDGVKDPDDEDNEAA